MKTENSEERFMREIRVVTRASLSFHAVNAEKAVVCQLLEKHKLSASDAKYSRVLSGTRPKNLCERRDL